MNNPIGWLFAWLSALLALRPRGRHRAGTVPPAPRTALSRPEAGNTDTPTAMPLSGPTSPHTDSPTPELRTAGLPLDDREPALVRPYVVAHEQRQVGAIPRVEPVCAPHSMAVTR
jgi:hypothetical protein